MVSRQYPWLSEGSYDRSCNYSFRTFHPSIATNTNIFLGFNFSSFRNRITEKQYFNYCWSIVQRWRCSKNIWLYDFLYVYKYRFFFRIFNLFLSWRKNWLALGIWSSRNRNALWCDSVLLLQRAAWKCRHKT